MAERAQVDEAKARERALERSYVPRFFSQAAFSGRGSGANTNGTDAAGLNGLGLERANWAVGLTVNFPILDFFSLRAQKRIETASRTRTLSDGLPKPRSESSSEGQSGCLDACSSTILT